VCAGGEGASGTVTTATVVKRAHACRPAEDRKGVKEVLVEMTKTARAAVRGSGGGSEETRS
jgi:hypothetical protein